MIDIFSRHVPGLLSCSGKKRRPTCRGYSGRLLKVAIPKMDQPCEQYEQVLTTQRYFSFAEIVKGRDASVRVTEDGLFFAVDLAMVVTGKDRDHAGQALRGLSDETFPSSKFSERKMPGKGNARTKLVNFPDGIELIMVLPGKVAREIRVKFSDIIKRYLAGDHSLITEVLHNAASDSPVAQMARASMDSPSLDEISRKRQFERDDALFEMEMAERRQRLLQSMTETQKTLQEQYTALCPGKILDDRARLLFQDNLLNLMPSRGMPSVGQLVESGVPVSAQEDTRPITISTFAAEEGKRYDTKALQRIGIIMSNLYQKNYGKKASQHEQFTDGAVRHVRSYTRKDQDLMREAFRLFDIEAGKFKP
jgi:hypothetical protein